MRIAVLRCERLPSFVTWQIPDVESLFGDDRSLLDALLERGIEAEPVAWTDRDADWGSSTPPCCAAPGTTSTTCRSSSR